MADNVENMSQDNGGASAQAPLPYESAWMAHWMQSSCPSSSSSSPSRAGKISAVDNLSKENHKGKQPALVIVPILEEHTCKDTETLKGVAEVAKPAFADVSLKRNSIKSRTEHVDLIPTTSGTGTQRKCNFLSVKGDATDIEKDLESGHRGFPFGRIASILSSNPATSWAEIGTSSGKSYFPPVGPAPNLDLSLKPHNLLARSSLDTETSRWNDATKSGLDLVLHGHVGMMDSMICGSHRMNLANSNLGSKDTLGNDKHCTSPYVLDKTNQGVLDNSRIFVSGFKGDAADCVADQHQHTSSLFSHQNCPAYGIEARKLYDGSSVVPQLPSSLQDVETMRIYTTLDTVEELSKGHPRLSHATHHLWITKKTDITLYECDQFARESKLSTKFIGSAFGNLLNVSPDVNHYVKHGQGVKLLSLRGSVDSDKEKVRDVKNSTMLKNESSAETNVMDYNALQKNHLSGIFSLSSNRHIDDQKSPNFQAASALGAKGIRAQPLTLVPDINQALPELPASPEDDRNSTSRTQTLDMEHFLSYAEQKTDSKSISDHLCVLGPEPSSRCIKRLRSSFDSAYGTKSLNLEDNLQEKTHKVFNKIVKARNSISVPKLIRYHGEGRMVPDVLDMSFLNGEPSSSNNTRKSEDIKLSHPWIQRWSQSLGLQKQIELAVVCQPEKSSAVSEEESQKKHFPSIAALALMGKALNGFQQCKVMKRGSVMVWNTNGD